MKLLIILLFCSALFSSDYEEHSKRHINKELSHLNLTKEQHRKVKLILKDFRAELKMYRKFERAIDAQRKDVFLKEKFDTDRLDELNNKLDRKAHLIENRLLKKIHAILSLQQRIKFIHYFDDWEVE